MQSSSHGSQVMATRVIRDYLLACFLDSFETNKIRCKTHVTYQFVVAQPNVPVITAPLFHGKPREEMDTSHPHPTATPPTPQLLYSPHTTEGRLPVGTSSLLKKETARMSKIETICYKVFPFEHGLVYFTHAHGFLFWKTQGAHWQPPLRRMW